jgi:hypothetical protein
VNGKAISCEAVVDSTIAGSVRGKQTVHRYVEIMLVMGTWRPWVDLNIFIGGFVEEAVTYGLSRNVTLNLIPQ